MCIGLHVKQPLFFSDIDETLIFSTHFRKICKYWKVKVKCTLVQALRLCTGRTAHRGSRGIALPFNDHGTRRSVRGQRHASAAFYPRERHGTHCTGVPGPIWTGAENLAPIGIQSPDRPARSQSLYRLLYSAHLQILGFIKISPVGAETDGQTKVTKLIVAFRLFAKVPKNYLVV